ncbi:hypothetical protein Tco_0704697, partial [Tanacetum coccineum]
MDDAAMKHTDSNFAKLDKFEGVDFRRWQKKMHFLLSSMSVVYVLTTSIPDDGDDANVDQIRKRAKFTQHKINIDEAIQVSCIIDKLPLSWKDFKHKKKELTLVELGSHLCIKESLRAQDSDKPKSNNVVGPQLNIVNDIRKSAIISAFKLNDSITWYVRLGNVHFNNNMQDMSKDGLILVLTWTLENIKLETNNFGADLYLLHTKDEALDKLKVFKTEVELQQVSLIKRFRTDREGEYMDTLYFQAESRVLGEIVRLPDPKLKPLGERGIECIFVGYAKHSKAFMYYVIEPNDSVAINSIIESRDTIFDENRFSSVPRPRLSIPKGTEDIGGSAVPEVVTDEVVQQPESELRKSNGNRTPKDFRHKFQLY